MDPSATPLASLIPYFLPQLLVALFVLIEGIIVLLQNPNSALHRSFFCFHLVTFCWLLFTGLAIVAPDPASAMPLAVAGLLGVLFVPVSTYAFSVYYADKLKQQPFIVAGFFITIIIAVLTLHPLFVQGLYHYPWGYYIHLGPLGNAALALFVIFIPLFIRNFYLRYKASLPGRRQWYGLALLFGALPFMAIIDFLPSYGIALPFPPPGYLVVGVFVTLMGYYMLRYRLTDMAILIGRTISYMTLTVILFLIYSAFFVLLFPGLHTLGEFLVNGLFFIAALYLSSWLLPKSRRFIDEMFFKEKTNFSDHIQQFTTSLQNLRTPHALLGTFFNFLTDILRVHSGTFFLFHNDEKRWHVWRNGDFHMDQPEYQDFSFSSEDERRIAASSGIIHIQHDAAKAFPQGNSARVALERLVQEQQGVIGIPLGHYGSFIGILVLGEKISGEPYTESERTALASIAAPFAIAWENAILYEEISRSSKAKNDFVSIASHQIRTPLTHMKWSIDLLKDNRTGALNAMQWHLITIFAQSLETMIELVGRLLDVVKIESGQTRVTVDAFAVPSLLQEVVRESTLAVRTKNLTCGLAVAADLPSVVADATYTKTILTILMQNAIKYTSEGGAISIRAERMNNRELLVTVKDTGIGVPADVQDHIFTKFFRARNALLIEPNGTGLGLFYAKRLAELQGGTIWFHSSEGKGSEFYLTIPTRRAIVRNDSERTAEALPF